MIYTMLTYLCHLLHIFILLSSGTNIENKTDRRMLRRKNKIDIVEYTEDFYSVRDVVLGTKRRILLPSTKSVHYDFLCQLCRLHRL